MDKRRLRIAAFAVGALLLAPTGAQAAPTRLAGTDVVGTHVSSAAPGGAEVYRTTAATTGDSTSISLHLDASSTASALEVGLYAEVDGQPSTLLTSARASAPAPGWNTVSVPAARLQAGTKYWIALLNPADATGNLSWTDRAGGTGGAEQGSGEAGLATLPDQWVPGPSYADGPLSAYVTGEPPAPAPILGVTPSALTFSAAAGGGSPAPKSLAIANNGVGSLSYSITDSATWLSVSPASGAAPGTSTVSVDPRNLAAGTYTANVRVAGADTTRDVPVTLTVSPSAAGGLVGAWSFNETSGETVLDSSGKRNTGAIQGATRTTGRYGRGLSFDGSNDWVTVADSASLDLTTGMTLEAWVKPESLNSAWRSVVVKEQTSHLAYALYANNDQGKPSGHVFTDADHGLAAPSGLVEGEWAHLATTWDGGILRVYVNAVEVASMPLSGRAVTTSGALRIGGNAVWAEWFKGQMDEVRVYNRALSADQILADRDTPIAQGTGSQMSPLEKLKALLLKLLAKWKKHFGDWTWHGHRGYFEGAR